MNTLAKARSIMSVARHNQFFDRNGRIKRVQVQGVTFFQIFKPGKPMFVEKTLEKAVKVLTL